MNDAAQFEMHSYPWYFVDWFTSEARAEFTFEEAGLYRELLDLCWYHGSLPDSEKLLAVWTGAIAARCCKPFGELLETVLKQFTLGEDGRYHHPKVDEKRGEILEFKERRKEVGRRYGHLGAEYGKLGGRPRKPPQGVSRGF